MHYPKDSCYLKEWQQDSCPCVTLIISCSRGLLLQKTLRGATLELKQTGVWTLILAVNLGTDDDLVCPSRVWCLPYAFWLHCDRKWDESEMARLLVEYQAGHWDKGMWACWPTSDQMWYKWESLRFISEMTVSVRRLSRVFNWSLGAEECKPSTKKYPASRVASIFPRWVGKEDWNMLDMNCRGCRQRFLPLPDLSRKIEGESVRRVQKEAYQREHRGQRLVSCSSLKTCHRAHVYSS